MGHKTKSHLVFELEDYNFIVSFQVVVIFNIVKIYVYNNLNFSGNNCWVLYLVFIQRQNDMYIQMHNFNTILTSEGGFPTVLLSQRWVSSWKICRIQETQLFWYIWRRTQMKFEMERIFLGLCQNHFHLKVKNIPHVFPLQNFNKTKLK